MKNPFNKHKRAFSATHALPRSEATVPHPRLGDKARLAEQNASALQLTVLLDSNVIRADKPQRTRRKY